MIADQVTGSLEITDGVSGGGRGFGCVANMVECVGNNLSCGPRGQSSPVILVNRSLGLPIAAGGPHPNHATEGSVRGVDFFEDLELVPVFDINNVSAVDSLSQLSSYARLYSTVEDDWG